MQSFKFGSASLIPVLGMIGLTGCGLSDKAPAAGPVPALRGQVHGGEQPVTGASIALYAAGTTGYGIGATSLLQTPVTTDSNGRFTLTGDYTCPSASSQLYLVATGGNPGLGAGQTNPALALMAAVGPCTLYGSQYTLDPNSFISINEVTTVAAVYALRAFMDPVTSQIGTSSTNPTGLANAFVAVQNLVNTTPGAALTTTPAGNGTVPQAEINTLANIITYCVNSDGTGTPCGSLFSATTPSGKTAPTNTIQALYNIATYPSNQVGTLYLLPPPMSPFQPTLSSAPNDWTMVVQYSGGNVTGPEDSDGSGGLAIDAQGDVWVLSNPFEQTASVAKFSNNGTLLSGAGFSGGDLAGSNGIAIDPSGDAWVVGQTNANVVKLDGTSGAVLSGANGFTGGGLTRPLAIAIDGNGKAWVSDSSAGAVIEIGPAGRMISGASGYSVAPGLAGIAIDKTGNVWVSGDGGPVYELNSSGGLISTSSGYSTGGVTSMKIAFDLNGNAWTNSSAQQTSLAELNSTGMLLSPTGGYASCTPPYNPNGVGKSCFWFAGQPMALDGAGNIWITSDSVTSTGGFNPIDTYSFAIAEVSNSGTILSGSNGYTGGVSFSNVGIGVDGSGDVWVLASAGSLLEFVGAATPVVTPFSLGVKNGTLGMMP